MDWPRPCSQSPPWWDTPLFTFQFKLFSSQRIYGTEAERNFYESQLIILDTLEQVLNSQPKDTSRLDEAMYVKLLLPEICKFLNLPNENQLVVQLKHLASKVLFALSQNNFTAVFNRISALWDARSWVTFIFWWFPFRLMTLSNSGEEITEINTDLELIQHINVDCSRLTRLLNGQSIRWISSRWLNVLQKPCRSSDTWRARMYISFWQSVLRRSGSLPHFHNFVTSWPNYRQSGIGWTITPRSSRSSRSVQMMSWQTAAISCLNSFTILLSVRGKRRKFGPCKWCCLFCVLYADYALIFGLVYC